MDIRTYTIIYTGISETQTYETSIQKMDLTFKRKKLFISLYINSRKTDYWFFSTK